jgi:hypothetical protein
MRQGQHFLRLSRRKWLRSIELFLQGVIDDRTCRETPSPILSDCAKPILHSKHQPAIATSLDGGAAEVEAT